MSMAQLAIIHNIPIHYKHLLFSELARRGLEFEVLFLASGSSNRIEVPDLSSAPYRSRVGFEGTYEASPGWRTASFVWRSLNQIRPRCVIISGWADAGAWTAKLWCFLHRCASILWAESNQCDRARVWWKELAKTIFVRGFDGAQVCGTTNAEYLAALGFDSRRICVKCSPADTGLFGLAEQREPQLNSRKVILFVGRLIPKKNIEFVLEAVRLLSLEARQALRFRFVGYGPLETSLRLKAESLGLNDTVEFDGPRIHSQLAETYHSADVLLLPSTSEPWGLTVIEAMLCGLPVILSERCGCARDLVNPGTGWSFNPHDAGAFAQILQKVAAMPTQELRAMGRNAAALASGYSPEQCASSVLQCLSMTTHYASIAA